MANPHRRALLQVAGCAIAGALVPLHSTASSLNLAPLRSLLEESSSGSIDYGEAKLTIDRMVAPELDYDSARREVNRLLSAAQRLIATVPLPLSPYDQKVEALRAVIYAPGVWNGFRPFMYDLEGDPTGRKNPLGPLLPNYLTTRRGQCSSMPALFLTLAQRIGLDAYLSTSPEHTLVKTRKPDGTYVNHECTYDAGPVPDASYIREHEITELALKRKTYLQPLSPLSAVVTMSGILVAHHATSGDAEAAHAVSDLLLEFEPNSFGATYCKLISYAAEQSPYMKYGTPAETPPEVRPKVFALLRTIDAWEAKVRAMGWTPSSQALEERSARIREAALDARRSK